MLMTLLSVVAGFVDAACFLGLNQVFTAHVTCNIAAFASSFVNPLPDGALRVAVLGAFAIGATGGRAAQIWFDRTQRPRGLDPFVCGEALWLALLLVANLFLPDEPLKQYALGSCAAAAMGCQSAGTGLRTEMRLPTTVMTSNFTQWAIALFDVLAPGIRPAPRREAFHDFMRLTLLLVAFGMGALAGALGEHRFGFSVLVVPLFALSIAIIALMSKR